MSTDANQLAASNRELVRLARRRAAMTNALEVAGAAVVVAGVAMASTMVAMITVGVFLYWAGWSRK